MTTAARIRWQHAILLPIEQIEDPDDIAEIDRWCVGEFGPKGGRWRSFSFGTFVFTSHHEAVAFRIHWGGEVLDPEPLQG